MTALIAVALGIGLPVEVAAAAQKGKAPAVVVSGVRLGEHGDSTRLVLDMNGSADAQVSVHTNPNRLEIALPGTGWREGISARKLGLVSGVTMTEDKDGAKLVIELAKPARVKASTLLKPADKHDYRFVFDLAPQAAAAFEAAAGTAAPKAKEEAKIAAAPAKVPEAKPAPEAKPEPKAEPAPSPLASAVANLPSQHKAAEAAPKVAEVKPPEPAPKAVEPKPVEAPKIAEAKAPEPKPAKVKPEPKAPEPKVAEARAPQAKAPEPSKIVAAAPAVTPAPTTPVTSKAIPALPGTKPPLTATIPAKPVAVAKPPAPPPVASAPEPLPPPPDRSSTRDKLASIVPEAAPVPPRPRLIEPLPKPGKRVVVIDPGHGGVDPGAKGTDGTLEKDVVLAVAKALGDRLIATGRYEVVHTRIDDAYLKLGDRVRVAREASASLFVSLHADALPNDPNVGGMSVYTLSEKASDSQAALLAQKENGADSIGGVSLKGEPNDVTMILIDLAQRQTMDLSNQFARSVVVDLDKETRLTKHTHRSAGFKVLKALDVPSALIELGYLSNAADLANLTSSDWQGRVADGIAASIDDYFRGLGDDAVRRAEAPVSP